MQQHNNTTTHNTTTQQHNNTQHNNTTTQQYNNTTTHNTTTQQHNITTHRHINILNTQKSFHQKSWLADVEKYHPPEHNSGEVVELLSKTILEDLTAFPFTKRTVESAAARVTTVVFWR
jgi:hypothetical protein